LVEHVGFGSWANLGVNAASELLVAAVAYTLHRKYIAAGGASAPAVVSASTKSL